MLQGDIGLQKKRKGVYAVALGTVLVALSLLGMVSVNAYAESGNLSEGEVDYWWISDVDKDDPVLISIQADTSFWESRVYYSNLTLIEEIYAGDTHIHEFIAAKTDEYLLRLYSPYYNFSYIVESTHPISGQPPDTTPPTISIISPENKSYPVNDVPLTFTVDEPTSWMGYSLDGAVNVTITGNTTLNGLLDGVHYVVVYANDTAGNMGTSSTVYFTVDTTPPNIMILSPENKTYTTSSVTLTFTIDEPTSWMGYSLDGTDNLTISGNQTLSLVDGLYSLVVYANDTAGNMGKSSTVYFTLDTTSPNITDVFQTPPKNNVQPTDAVKINATITDSLSGVKLVIINYTNGNGTWITRNMENLTLNIWNYTIDPFPYCTNVTYVIIAVDNANNTITSEELGYDIHYHVIPELPSFLILPLFMIVTLLAVIIYKRKCERQG